jgi:RecB family endonuclease NucS
MLYEDKIMSYATIKELVIDSYVSEGCMPSYESLTQKVRNNFPTSAWQKSHYSWYKSQINTGKIQISEQSINEVEVTDEFIEENIAQSIDTQVSLEKDLQQYFSSRVNELEQGLLLVENGIEYSTEAGRIDLLAKDTSNHLVVVELKAVKAKDSALGQLLGYIGCLSQEGKDVRGILVASEFEKRVIFATKVLPNINLIKYDLSFNPSQ